MIKKSQGLVKFSCCFSSTCIITQFFKWPCKNWMPLYITVLIYKAIYMKLSSYWVTCVPFKQCRGQISSYGIQDQKVQLWNEFLTLGNTGSWFFNNNPIINPSIPNPNTKRSIRRKLYKPNFGKRNAKNGTYSSNNFSTAVGREWEAYVKCWRKPVKCSKIFSLRAFCHIRDLFLAYLS